MPLFKYLSAFAAQSITPSSLQLTAKKLNETIASMHQNHQYKQMVVYVEACESGSMFKNVLPDDINGGFTNYANIYIGISTINFPLPP